MPTVLHPRAAPGDRLQVWIGAFGRTAEPTLQWTLNGTAARPVALRPIASARAGAMLVDTQEPRAYAGVYEFREAIEPDTTYTVSVAADGEQATRQIRTLPLHVPVGVGASFNILLVSCFHAATDVQGYAGRLADGFMGPHRPHMTILMGDQVYLDLPAFRNFPDELPWLARQFEEYYAHNWGGHVADPSAPVGYTRLLGAAPSVSTPDDHEYWNNFPHRAVHVQNTWGAGGRARWGGAARAMYEAFQAPQPGGIERAFELDVPPLSIFVMDMRTHRDAGKRFALRPDHLAQLRAWRTRIADAGLVGLVVSGQSLFEKKPGWFKGALGDYELPNYDDYGDIARELVGAFETGGAPVVCATGDKHWGRVVAATDRVSQRVALYEVMASPSALLDARATTAQPLSESLDAEWPRHGDAGKPADFFAQHAFGKRFETTMLHRQRGNHVAMLSFTHAGGGLDLEVTYYPIFPQGRAAAPWPLGSRLKLRHAL